MMFDWRPPSVEAKDNGGNGVRSVLLGVFFLTIPSFIPLIQLQSATKAKATVSTYLPSSDTPLLSERRNNVRTSVELIANLSRVDSGASSRLSHRSSPNSMLPTTTVLQGGSTNRARGDIWDPCL